MARENRAKREERRFGRPERLADRLWQMQWGSVHWCRDSARYLPLVDWFKEGVRRSVVISITNVADYHFRHQDTFCDKGWTELPSMPPYPMCFIETSTPPSFLALAGDCSRFPHFPRAWGWLCITLDSDQTRVAIEEQRTRTGHEPVNVPESFSHGVNMILVKERVDGCIHGPLLTVGFYLDDAGKLVESPFTTLFDEDLADPEEIEGYRHEAEWFGAPVLLAFAFMHCKNVAVESHDPDPAINRERKKAGRKPFVRYHTINIEPMKRVLRTEGQVEKVGLARALHIVRGHFATYTPEKPLFGRVAGTVWRPAHVRGSADEGIVVSDYEVGSPKP